MALISAAGSLNTTALVVPDLYIQIVPPTLLGLNGVPSNSIGVVGTASYGPVNKPVVFGAYSGGASIFGPLNARKYDMLTPVYLAQLQGASSFVGVRVTDSTDTAATGQEDPNAGDTAWGVTATAAYTGSVGNSTMLILTVPGARGAGYADLVVQNPVLGVQESFSSIPNASPAAFWPLLVSAVNTGAAIGWLSARNPSRLITMAVGTNDASIAVASSVLTLSGGTDGASGVTATQMLGVDGLARTGMYALRSQGCSLGVLADCDTPSSWSTQASFGLGEGVYMIAVDAAGDTVSAAPGVIQGAGLSSYAVKLMFGDWLYWADPVNLTTRMVSPQGFVAGRLANLSPEQSSLNKEIYGISYSQRSGNTASQTGTYSSAELTTLIQAGFDVICNPAPGGSYWACRAGHNTAGYNTTATYQDPYTRLTNYISATLAAGMGIYVGQVINSTLLLNIKSTLLGYLGGLLSQGVLGSVTGATPYAVVCDASNNPQSRTALGYVQADVQVQYQGINEKFLVNLQGGSSVVVSSATQQVTGLNGVTGQ